MEPKATPSSRRNKSRRYHPLPSKHRMNVTRYKARGMIQSSGIAAMFWVMWCVMLMKSAEPQAARAIQRLFVTHPGAGELADSIPFEMPWPRTELSAKIAHSIATHAYAQDHPLA